MMLTSKPLLYLHIGVHKTGTTSIQKYCAKHRKQLADNGVCYPRFAGPHFPSNAGHHHVAHVLADEGSAGATQEDVDSFIGDLKSQAHKYRCFVLSAEPMCRHTWQKNELGEQDGKKAYICRIKTTFSEFDVRIIVFVRDRLKFIRSLYKESVLKSGYNQSLTDFYKEKKESALFGSIITNWAEVFGSENLIVREFAPELENFDIINEFLKVIGCEAKEISSDTTDEISNVSASDPVVELKRLLNTDKLRGRQNILMRRVLDDVDSDGQLSGYLTEFGEKTVEVITATQEERSDSELVQEFLASNESQLESSSEMHLSSFAFNNTIDTDIFSLIGFAYQIILKDIYSDLIQCVDQRSEHSSEQTLIQVVRKIIELCPNDPTGYRTLFILLEQSGQGHEIARYQKTIRKELSRSALGEMITEFPQLKNV